MIKAETKKGQSVLATAHRNIGTNLYDVYGRYSVKKAQAMEDCKRRCYEMKGENFHICSANSFQFTVAWIYPHPEYGNMCTHVETASSVYDVDNI